MTIAEKRKRITVSDSTQFVQLLGSLDIISDASLGTNAFNVLIPLCRARNLTSYDAAYLELALLRQLPLATLDEDLRNAATSVGIALLGK